MKRYEARFYESPSGECQPCEFMRLLKRTNPKAFAKCAAYVRQVEEQGLDLPYDYIRKVEGDVWELRPEFGGVEYRLFFGSVGGNRFGVVAAYQKRWQRVPDNIRKLAAERIREMRSATDG